ncbi:MAG: hypothetical protein KDB27_13130 [Planctomycetales bacterium]|nr:hypothetical protein [Planctomycetales bacterium]
MNRTIHLLATMMCICCGVFAWADPVPDERGRQVSNIYRLPSPLLLDNGSEFRIHTPREVFGTDATNHSARGSTYSPAALAAGTGHPNAIQRQVDASHDLFNGNVPAFEQLSCNKIESDGYGGAAQPISATDALFEEPLPAPSVVDLAMPNVAWLDSDEEEASEQAGADIRLTSPDEVFTSSFRERTQLSSRIGWWSVNSKGNPSKVGEYQSLNSSLFADLDGFLSDGVRTWDFHATNLDNDAQSAGMNWYSPFLQANIDYEGYLRRLDRDPLDFYVDFDQQPARPLPAPPANFRDMKEDRAAGADFAIRVQQLEARFQGKLTDKANWKLNFWAMRKHGERQANAMAHCFTAQNATDTNGDPAPGPACHQLSQSQRIDWLTAEIEPGLQAKFGSVSADYTRTMRTLTTDDQVVTRPYDNFGFSGDQPYAVVPENYTYIDRLKLSSPLPEHRNVYANLFNGNTRNEFRDTNRRFRGYDVRLTDRSVPGVSVTGYAKQYLQSGQAPKSLLLFENVTAIRVPIAYDRTTFGATASWRPFYGEYSRRRHWRLSGGYEYRKLERENAIFEESALTVDQGSTLMNQVHLRASTKWASTWDSFTRYRVTFVDDPLFAVPIANTTTNTNLPTQTHRVEFGNTWSPSHSFMINNLVSYHNGENASDVAQFDVDNYDCVLSVWWAATPTWSFSAGLGLYSNWIDQAITLGSKTDPLTQEWQYGGRSSVVNFGTTYAWTTKTTLSGNIDLVRGHNSFDPLEPFTDLPVLSDVIVETTRFTAGLDHELGPNSNLYVRYQLFDYDDESDLFAGGTAKMLLVGLHARF